MRAFISHMSIYAYAWKSSGYGQRWSQSSGHPETLAPGTGGRAVDPTRRIARTPRLSPERSNAKPDAVPTPPRAVTPPCDARHRCVPVVSAGRRTDPRSNGAHAARCRGSVLSDAHSLGGRCGPDARGRPDRTRAGHPARASRDASSGSMASRWPARKSSSGNAMRWAVTTMSTATPARVTRISRAMAS